MSRTLTALFDTRADAEAAQSHLVAAHVDAGHVRLHDQASEGYGDIASGSTTSKPNTGIWASIKNAFLPDEDRSVYEEGLRRGGTLLTADVNDNEIDEAIRVLEDSNGIDMDSRQGDWHAGGWAAPAVGAAAGMATAPMINRTTDMDRRDTRTTDDGMVQKIEEQLVVGKREVARGGLRVRSYVVSTPVMEQVRLRDEHVEVERRPVDRAISAADGDPFRERTIELTETGEEAVVGKSARVVEEVGLRKDVGERVEEVKDTVRHTEVEVERIAGTETDRVAGTRPMDPTKR